MSIQENRHHKNRIIKKRSKIWNNCLVKGKLVKNNYSCGCQMCKPWKHKKGNKFKVSERKNLF